VKFLRDAMLLKSFNKYLTVFKLSWQNILQYRLDFLMGRVRNIILLLTLYFLWTTVFKNPSQLFGFTRAQIVTYVLVGNFFYSLIFAHSDNDIADAIASGRLSSFLVRPINYLFYWFVRRLASRLMFVLMTILETVVFVVLIRPDLQIPVSPQAVLLTSAALVLAIALFTFLDFSVGTLAFWTLHAYGPRFALRMLMDFTSGRMFPLNILPRAAFAVLNILPFSFLIFFPVNLFQNRLGPTEIVHGFTIQALWLVLSFLLMRWLWHSGLRKYEAVGG
jgi:ABC-2 type transport system permease protein